MKGWKSIVATVAPALATALGGPLAGLAVREIGKGVLGKEDAKEAEVAAAIATGGSEMFGKLKELDLQFEARMAELGIELERLDVEDRANARARQIALRDWVPSVLAVANAVAFFALLFLMMKRPIPEANRDAINILLGVLGGSLGTVMTYYFGSSHGSRAKDEVLGRAVTGGK